MFRYCADHLDVTVLGMLQADSQGNVNVSKKSARIQDYVGPGGFPDLVSAAKAIIFVGAFTAKSQTVVENGRVRVIKSGIPKFVEHVDEVTFCGPEALKGGKKVFYVTPVGTLQLTARGLELIEVMPGVDVQRDILDASPATILLPECGTVPVAPEAYLTGKGFRLAWGKGIA